MDEVAGDGISTERVLSRNGTNPVDGTVKWDASKSLWLSGMTLTALFLAPVHFSWGAVLVFLVLTAVTICLGHSVGMHRLLIHRSFRTPIWLERTLVYLGVLVGMAGPFGMIRLHDIRDWGQMQPACHDYFAHRAGIWKNAWWHLHCRFDFSEPPEYRLEHTIADDRYYKFMERTWMVQQVPLALILFALGGMPWVVWGICVRVSISLIGHWMIVYYAHQPRPSVIHIEGACVQGYNLPKLALVTFGECFHENHHAYPGSACMGFMPGQLDLSWWVICLLERVGLATDIRTPADLPAKPGMTIIDNRESGQCNSMPSWLIPNEQRRSQHSEVWRKNGGRGWD